MRVPSISALVLLALLLGLGVDARAAIDVITFDDLAAPSPSIGYGVVPNGYHSLDWNNFDYLSATQSVAAPGYQNGLVSSPNVAFNQNALPASISAATPFDVTAVYVTSALDTTTQGPLSVDIIGSRSGMVVYQNYFLVVSAGPTLLLLNYANVDKVEFASRGPISSMAVDNLSVKMPEPAVSALAALALLGLALGRGADRRSPRLAVQRF